jgi:hypothetical protein
MGADPAPSNDGVAAKKRTGRWQQVRRLAKLASAIIAAAGIASAGIGYVVNGAQFFVQIAEYFQGRSELRSLIASADERLRHGDNESAWRFNAKARELAPGSEDAAAQQARIAMKWIEHAQYSSAAGGPKNFSEIVDPLRSALLERLADASIKEKADIHAHIGWANFLRYRDGNPSADVAEEFDAAIAEDPDNLYGHVMRGFWILWQGGPIDKARKDLDFALRSSTDPAFSDHLIMSALTNITSDDFMAAAIEYADKIRQTGRNIDDHTKSQLIWYYSIAMHSKDVLQTLSRAMPAGEQTLVLDWLRQADMDPSLKRVAAYFIAYFTESDGKKAEALQLYRDLVGSSPDMDEYVTQLSQAAVTRLQKQ